MAEKLRFYQGFLGRLHYWRDEIRDRWEKTRETLRCMFTNPPPPREEENLEVKYAHIYRKKTRLELIQASAAIMGIEFSYAAETAFVSPILLKIGVEHSKMTMIWALSPLIGFFLTPILGSLSDKCRLQLGRRRPFIILLAVGVILGLLLIPNGMDIGHYLGDYYPSLDGYRNDTSGNHFPDSHYPHPWSIVITVLGTALLDFDADASQSPIRAYLLDVSLPEDHARGLSSFTLMAGLGGFMGYGLGGINWDNTFLGKLLGGHIKAVFTLVTIIFLVCVTLTLMSFKEVPLPILEKWSPFQSQELSPVTTFNGSQQQKNYGSLEKENVSLDGSEQEETNKNFSSSTKQDQSNGVVNYAFDTNQIIKETSFIENNRNDVSPSTSENVPSSPSLLFYLKSIIFMPNSLRILCLTNFFCWMAHVCYSLNFTDFVGEAVFGGDPKAEIGSESRTLYEDGVRFGCWGMAMYSLSCAAYSFVIEKLINRFKARPVYVGGLIFYSLGMLILAFFRHKITVIILSTAAGVMYSTLFTMPYLLIAQYHHTGIFAENQPGGKKQKIQRGLGTDVAVVSSMVFLAQFILSLAMGTIVELTGTTSAIVCVASGIAFCGAIAATQVLYLDA